GLGVVAAAALQLGHLLDEAGALPLVPGLAGLGPAVRAVGVGLELVGDRGVVEDGELDEVDDEERLAGADGLRRRVFGAGLPLVEAGVVVQHGGNPAGQDALMVLVQRAGSVEVSR